MFILENEYLTVPDIQFQTVGFCLETRSYGNDLLFNMYVWLSKHNKDETIKIRE